MSGNAKEEGVAAPSDSSLPKPSAFPKRVERSSFPHQPHGGQGRLPVTLQNVEHLLLENQVDVRWDVIKKTLRVSRHGDELELPTLDSLANLNGLNSGSFGDFVGVLGRRRPINPALDWIDSKPWDGVSRLADLCATIECDGEFSIKLKDKLLVRWLLSGAAAAILSQGFKARGVLVLQGGQGLGKTTWFARLVPEDLRQHLVLLDHHLDPHSKDSVFNACSHWYVEIGELDSSFKKDIARLKGFITNDCDKVRLPYGKRPIEMPRRTVFAGSVNDPNFLIDPTGNSRFWTIPCTKIDYQHSIDMQQLFAELAVMVRNGTHWWLSPDEEAELLKSNERFNSVSVLEEKFLDRFNPDEPKPRYRTASQVCAVLGYSYPGNSMAREMGGILRRHVGEPRRVQGRTCWKVGLCESDYQPDDQEVEDPEDLY